MTDGAIRPGLRVLVAEDEALVSMLIEDMLTEMGAAVVGPAATLDEAMTLAKGDGFDIALLDVNLAGKPIFPIADVLREKGVPFIFASGYGEAGIIEAHRGAAEQHQIDRAHCRDDQRHRRDFEKAEDRLACIARHVVDQKVGGGADQGTGAAQDGGVGQRDQEPPCGHR